jgi:hypothetical protein
LSERQRAADEADDIGVDMSKEKGHGTTGMEGSSIYTYGEEANVGTKGHDREAEGLSDVGGRDGIASDAGTGLVVIGGQWGGKG